MLRLSDFVKGISEGFIESFYSNFVRDFKRQVKVYLKLRGFDYRMIDTTKHDGFYLIIESTGQPLAKFYLNVQLHKYNLDVRGEVPYVSADIEVESLRKTKSGKSLRGRDRYEVSSHSPADMTVSLQDIIRDMTNRFF